MAHQQKIRLTGSFGAITVEDLLQRLAFSLDIHYKKEDGKIIIY